VRQPASLFEGRDSTAVSAGAVPASLQQRNPHPTILGMRRNRTAPLTPLPVTPRYARTPTLKKLVAQINPKDRYGERSTGPARGKEKLGAQ
jgi:hypothetical protein